MAYVYSGNSRSFRVTVTKYVNGVPQTPTTYPTATDIANGYFTYSGGQVPIPSPETLAQMTSSEYAAILIALQTYAQEQNPGLNFSTAVVTVPAVIENDPNCPVPGTPAEPAATTTTTTTTSEEVVQFALIGRPVGGGSGTIQLCGESPTNGDVTDLATVDTIYFLSSSPVPTDGQQLYSDYGLTTPYERSQDALWAMRTDNGGGLFDYYDLYITLSGTVSGYFACDV